MYQVRHVRFDNSSMIDSPFGELTASLAKAQSIVEEFNEIQRKNVSQSSVCDKCGFRSIFIKDASTILEVKDKCQCSKYAPIQSDFTDKNIENELLYQVDCSNCIHIQDVGEKMYVNIVEI